MRCRHRTGAVIVSGLGLAAALWMFVLVGAPHAVTHVAPTEPLFVAATMVYVVGSVVCHQQAARSFHLDETQLPVCARCTGLYAGAPLGLLLALPLVTRRGAPREGRPNGWGQLRAVLILAAIPTAVTVVTEGAGVVQVTDVVRAVAAVPLSAAVAAIVGLTLGGALGDDRLGTDESG